MTDNTGLALQGSLVDLSPYALSVLVYGTRVALQETDVFSIRQHRPDSVKNGVAWGFWIGAALGVSYLKLTSGSEVLNYPVACVEAASLGDAGASIGALVDANHSGSRVVYDPTRGSSRRVSVSPLLSRNRKGVAVSLGF